MEIEKFCKNLSQIRKSNGNKEILFISIVLKNEDRHTMAFNDRKLQDNYVKLSCTISPDSNSDW